MGYRDPQKQHAYQNQWLKDRRLRRLEWLAANGPCIKCGSSEKLFISHKEVNGRLLHNIWGCSEETRTQELKNAQVLCHRCFEKKQAQRKQRPIPHGKANSYRKRGCRCELCKAAQRKEVRKYRLLAYVRRANAALRIW